VKKAMQNELLESVLVGEKEVMVNMLQYADDKLFFCKAST